MLSQFHLTLDELATAACTRQRKDKQKYTDDNFLLLSNAFFLGKKKYLIKFHLTLEDHHVGNFGIEWFSAELGEHL